MLQQTDLIGYNVIGFLSIYKLLGGVFGYQFSVWHWNSVMTGEVAFTNQILKHQIKVYHFKSSIFPSFKIWTSGKQKFIKPICSNTDVLSCIHDSGMLYTQHLVINVRARSQGTFDVEALFRQEGWGPPWGPQWVQGEALVGAQGAKPPEANGYYTFTE